MDAIRECVLRCLPGAVVTSAGTLSASDDSDGEDRISALPDELLCDVVSRLPIKDAARTAVLSPRWRRVWRSTPLVLYDAHIFPASSEDARVATIHRILAGHPSPLRTVHIVYCFLGMRERELGEWSRFLAAGGVQDLVLCNDSISRIMYYPSQPLETPLPADILRCTKLRRLYLGFFNFPDTSDLPNEAGVFPHLREFVLLSTSIEDRDFAHMLGSSPELETLAVVTSALSKVRLLGKNLKCVLFWLSMADELAMVDAPFLERLIMWWTCPPAFQESDDESYMRVRIACAPKLKVLGYLELGVHELQIEHTIIKADTKVSPSSMVPSVKILALRVDFSVPSKVQMLASVLRCFPNIETLHVESAVPDEPIGKHYAEFFEKLSPIECVQNNIKKMVLHEFQGDISEMAFLEFITQRANKLQKLTLVLRDEALVQVGQDLLRALSIPLWASKICVILLVGPIVNRDWDFHRASDLSIDDPFLLEHEHELFRLVKKEE